MPKIPTTQQTVSTQTPRVAEYNIPGAVRGAFGENVTAATSKLIEGVGDIGQMFQEKAEQMYKVKNAELENEFILANQDILHNDKTKVIKIDGVDTEIPDGIGDRMGYQTNGAATEYEKRSADLRDSILKKVKHEGYRSELTQRLSSHYLSGREFTIKHEIAETRKAAKDTFDALSKTLVESVKADPATLGMAIDKIIKNHLDERNRLGTPLAQMDFEVNEDIAKATYNAADSILQMGGTLKEAKALLNDEKIKAKIPKEKYGEIVEGLEVSDRQLRNLRESQAEQFRTEREDELIQMKVNNSASYSDLMRMAKNDMNKGILKPRFAEAYINSLLRKEEAETKSETFNNIAEDILNPEKNPEDIKLKILQKNATGEISDEDFNVLNTFNQGITKDTLEKVLPKKSFLQAISIWSDEYAEEKPEIKARLFKRYMEGVSKGQTPEIAINEAIRKEVMILHPQAATYPQEGKETMDKNGAIKTITPMGDILDVEAPKPKVK